MLMIRLQRTGRENLPTYRVVVTEKTNPAKGKFHEILGHYLPAQNPPVWHVDGEKISQWVSKGATPSDTVARIAAKNGVKGMEKFITRYAKRKSKNEQPPEAAPAPAAAPAAPAAEAPAA